MRLPNGCPVAPDYLSEGAVSVWNGLVPDLKRTGLLAKAHGLGLAVFCELFAEWRENPRELSAGKLKELRLFMGEFGLTFSAGLKMKAPEGAEDEPEESCNPTTGGNVVSISALLSRTPKMSVPAASTPATTSAPPASDS
jgi:hypothetical protein